MNDYAATKGRAQVFKANHGNAVFLFCLPVNQFTLLSNRQRKSFPTVAYFALSRRRLFKKRSKDTKICLEAKKHPIVFFENSGDILVSIIIPVFNQLEVTLGCLRSLARYLPEAIRCQVIIADDASTPETVKALSAIKGLQIVSSATNRGFLHTANMGARAASGKYLLFLNNDTEIFSGCIESLLEVFQNFSDAGIAGGLLLEPNGKILEAGGIINANGEPENAGRRRHWVDPRFNFVRRVDYTSGACLMIRKSDFEAMGGFDPVFAPGYFEDTDLSMRVRETLQKAAYFTPFARLVHHEGVSSANVAGGGMKAHMKRNAPIFRARWFSTLSEQCPKRESFDFAMRRRNSAKILIYIDSVQLTPDQDSGSRRAWQILFLLKELGYHVIFYPFNGEKISPYTENLQRAGIEVLYHDESTGRSPWTQAESLLGITTIAWVARTENYFPLREMLLAHRHLKIIFDTVDLHYVRLKRGAELGDAYSLKNDWQVMRENEFRAMRETDLTLVVTEAEKQLLADEGFSNVRVIPNIHPLEKIASPAFATRRDLLFIGGFSHHANVDAIMWFVHEVFPLVRAQLPNVKLNLVGSKTPKTIFALASESIQILGYVPDVSTIFSNARVFVSPLRFGAGMKGKIGQTLEFGLPAVTTSIGAEGMNLVHRQHALIADSATDFAASVVELYNTESLWQSLRENSGRALASYQPAVVREQIKSCLATLGDFRL